MGADTIDGVEYYSGYKGEETPRFVTISGIRHRVLQVSGRKRTYAAGTDEVAEEFQCLLDDGRTVSVKRPVAQ